MFRERIEKPIDPIPLEYANSLKRIYNEPDYSLTSLGIAMLKSRIDGYSGIDGTYVSYDHKADCLGDFFERVKMIDEHPLFCYYIYTDDNVSDDYIETHFPEFKEKKNVELFIKEKAECDCLVLYHETMAAVGIFVNSKDFRLYHLLLSFMSLYYPSLFVDKPLTDDDYALIKSLSNKEKNKFFECIKNLVKPYIVEFRRGQLTTLMKSIHQVKIDRARSDVDNKRYELREIEERYGEAVRTLKNLIVIYEGMVATENYDNPEQELVEYLSTNPDIHDLKIVDGRLKFSVTTLLNNYNAQAWEIFSQRGHIYDGEYCTTLVNTFRDKNNRKILLDNIFSEDPVFIVKVCGNYDLDLNNCRVYTHSNYDYDNVDPLFQSYLPNPHLKLFDCLGGYKDRIMPMLRDRNYISAVETCIASAGSVNLDETQQTFRPFIGWILNSTEKILKMKDGTEMTPEEALVWLIDKEKENETN